MSDENKMPDLSFDAYLRSIGGGTKLDRLMWSIDPLMTVEKHNAVCQLTHDYRRMVDAADQFRQKYSAYFTQWANEQVALGREYATLTAGEFERDTHLLALVRAGLPEDTEEFVRMPFSELLK